MKWEKLLHLLFWGTTIAYVLFANWIRGSESANGVIIFLTYTNFALVTYTTSLFILPKLFKRKKWISFTFSILALWCSFLAIDYWIEFILEVSYYTNTPVDFSLASFVVTMTWFFISYFAYGVGYYLLLEAVKVKSQLKDLQINEYKRNNKRLELENSLLRSNINPQFLFDYLRHLETLASEDKNQILRAGIGILSDLMKFSIGQSKTQKPQLIINELQHVRCLVNLYHLRFGDKLNFQMRVDGCLDKTFFIPNVLITLVENIFKHGDLFDKDSPAKIYIRKRGSCLMLCSSNKRRKEAVLDKSGLGLNNIQERLKYEYRSGFSFRIMNLKDRFIAFVSANLTDNE